MKAVARLEKEQLKEMGVKLGHISFIVDAINAHKAEQEFALGLKYERVEAAHPSIAFKHFERAAELGHAEAMVKTASFLLRGFNAAKINDARAFRLLQVAYEKKAKGAPYWFGVAVYHGRGCAADEKKAHEIWKADSSDMMCKVKFMTNGDRVRELQKLAESGDVEAQFRLSVYLWDTSGQEKASLPWEKRAADNGHAQAQENRAVVLAEGREALGIAKDDKEAVKWRALARAQGQV